MNRTARNAAPQTTAEVSTTEMAHPFALNTMVTSATDAARARGPQIPATVIANVGSDGNFDGTYTIKSPRGHETQVSAERFIAAPQQGVAAAFYGRLASWWSEHPNARMIPPTTLAAEYDKAVEDVRTAVTTEEATSIAVVEPAPDTEPVVTASDKPAPEMNMEEGHPYGISFLPEPTAPVTTEQPVEEEAPASITAEAQPFNTEMDAIIDEVIPGHADRMAAARQSALELTDDAPAVSEEEPVAAEEPTVSLIIQEAEIEPGSPLDNLLSAEPVVAAEEPTVEPPTAPEDPTPAPRRREARPRATADPTAAHRMSRADRDARAAAVPVPGSIRDCARQFLAYLGTEEGKDARTIYTYGKDVEVIENYFGPDTPLGQLNIMRVSEFLASDHLRCLPNGAERAKPTFDKIVRVLRMMLTWAPKAGFVTVGLPDGMKGRWVPQADRPVTVAVNTAAEDVTAPTEEVTAPTDQPTA